MTNNRVRINCDIDADIGQAKKAINDLQQSIEKLSKAQINTNYLDKGINNAVAAARELQHHLNAALNQNTGKLNLNAFTSSLEQSNISAKDLMQTLLQGGSAGQQTFASLANAIAQSEVPLHRANKTLQDFATTLKNTVKWEISSTMVHGLESALSGAVSYAKNLNTSLTNIRIVTGQSVDDMARFAKEANVAAKALSTTTKSYADASLIYYQQGDSQEMAAKKAAITIKASNASFETSAKEMSEYLTAVWNSYQVGADELERYVDIMANLGAKTATSLEEIATSMQKVAATANTVGVSMEQVSSIIATVSSVTRESAESIGTSYKTIFARIGDLKLGKVDEDGVGLGQVSSQLDAIGVKILDGSGNLREMGDIIMDLGNKWQTMNQAQKTAVAQVVAGKRQYTQLMALFENWPMYMQNMNIAENSEGSLQKMADTYAESWEAASAKVQASLEGIYSQILNDQAIIKLTNGFASIIDGVDTLIERLGGMAGTLTTLGSIGINVFSKQIAGGINKTVHNISTFMSQFNSIGSIYTKFKTNNIESSEQIEYKKALADWDQQIAKVKSTTGEGSAESIALQNSRDLLQVKQDLINAEHSLNEAQKARAQSLIGQYSAEQEHLLKVAQQKEQLIKNEKQDDAKYVQRLINERTNDGKTSSSQARALFQQSYNDNITSYREQAFRHATLSSTQTSLEKIKSADSKTVTDEIERLKKILGTELSSEIFNDFDGDIDKIIEKLRNLQDETEETMGQIADDMKTGMSESEKKIVNEALETAFSDADTKANLQFETEGAQSGLDSLKEKISEVFSADSVVMEKFGEKLAAAGGTLTAMVGGFEAGASLVEVWNDETAGIGDHLAAAAGVVTNLASAFAAGGPWGLALTAVTMVVSGIIQAAEEAEKAYQEAQSQKFEKMQETASKKDEELSNISNLIKNYNTLKETYDTTNTGQDALAESARALAEAYGLVGANILIAEGRFSDFERMIAQQTGLKNIETFYQTQIDQLLADVNVVDKNSKYNINKSKMIIGDDKTGEFTYFGGGRLDFSDQSQKYGAQYSQSELDFRLMSDITLGYNEAITARDEAIDAETEYWRDNAKEIGQLTSDIAIYKAKRLEKEDENGELKYSSKKQFSSRTIKTNRYGDATAFDAKAIEKGKKDIDNFFSDIMSKETEQRITEFKEQWETLGEEDKKGRRLVSDTVILNFINEMNETRTSLINKQVDSLTVELQTIYDNFDEAVLTEAQAKIDGIKTNTTEMLQSEFSEELKKASGFIEGQTDYYDYFTGLYDEEGKLFFDEQNGDRIAWNNQVKTNLDKLEQEIQSIELHERKEGSPLDKALDARYAELKIYKEVLESFYNINLTEASEQLQKWQKMKDQASIINNTIQTMIGRNETNATFGEFNTWFNQITGSLKKTAAVNEKFKDVIELDEAEEYGYRIKEGFDSEFKAILNDIASGYISSLTSFDNFLYIYQDLAAIFTDNKEYDAVMAYMDREGQEIRDARLVDSSLVHAMQQDLVNDGAIGANADRVLAFNQQKLKADEAITNYQSALKLSDSYKENLSYEDAFALQEMLIKEGNDAWENFLAMDADARTAYLESRRDVYLQKAVDEQNNKAISAENEMFALYGYDKSKLKDEKTLLAAQENINTQYQKDLGLIEDFQNAGFVKQTDGSYVNDQGVVARNVADYEAALGRVTNYNAAKTAQEEAEEAKRAFELVAKGEDRAITKLNRMKAAISELPTDMKEFNKLIQQLGNIDPKELINMSNLERAELILNNLEKPQESTYWYEENGEKKFNAAGYAEALRAYEEARSNALDMIAQDAEKAFARIETRANQAREEAEKTKAIAETLSSSIDSGYLTETQKLNMSPELISQWESASNAVERGAIAAKMWSKYAADVALASEDILVNYNNAETAQDIKLKAWKERGLTDLSGYDFQDKNSKQFEEYVSRNIVGKENQAIWNKAFQDLIAKTDISGMSDIDILEAVRQQISETGDLAEAEFDQIMAGVKDSIVQTYAQLGEQEASLAQQVVDDWESAFRQIADLRRSIIMGEDIGSDLTASLGDYVRYANAYTGEGSLAAAYKSGKLTADQMALGSGKELTEKLLASMGLSNNGYDLFAEYTDGLHLKEMSLLARQFGITKDEERFKIDGKFDQKLYENAIREAAKPFLQNLLLQSGMDATTANQLLSEFMLGSNTAIETINQAANKMLDVSEEYSQLLTDNEKLAEADAAFQKAKTEQEEKQVKAQKYADVTNSIIELSPAERTPEKIVELLNNAGVSSTDYMASVQKTTGINIHSLDDIASLDHQQLVNYENAMQKDAIAAGGKIVDAANDFYNIVTGVKGTEITDSEGNIIGTGLGFSSGSVAEKTASKYLTEAQDANQRSLDSYQVDNYSDFDPVVKGAVNQFESLAAMDNIKQGTAEWFSGIDNLKEAYAGLEGADEIINALKDGTIDLKEANDGLVDITMNAVGAVGKLSDAQWEQYKNALRANNVTKDGYKKLEDYIEVMEAARKTGKDLAKQLNKTGDGADELAEEIEAARETTEDFSDDAKIAQKAIEKIDFSQFADGVEEATALKDVFSKIFSSGETYSDIQNFANYINSNQIDWSYLFNAAQASSSAEAMKTELANILAQTDADVTALVDSAGGSWTTIYDILMALLAKINPENYNAAAEALNAFFASIDVGMTVPKFSGGGGSGGSRVPKKSGGGGGGKKEKKEKLRARDEIPRYHTNEKVLESIESTLTEIDKLKDRAYGADHVAQLDAETEALKRQLEAQQALKEEAESYIPQDKGEFLKYGAQFDADGVITNYEDVMQAIMDEYNQAIEDYNNSAQKDSDKERLEEAKQKYDDLKDSIEKYEEAIQKAQDAANEMLEIQNRMSELELEKITYKLELEIEVNDSDLEIIDYYKNKYEDSLKDRDEYFNKLVEANVVYEENLTHLREAEEELNAKYKAGLINDADYAEGLADIQSQMLDNLNSIEELKDEIAEAYENTLEMAREQIEEITDLIDGSISSLESYINILELSGRGRDYDTLKDMYEALYQNNFALININKVHLDSLKAEEDALLRKYNGDSEAMSEADKERHMVLRKQIQETQDALNEATQATLETLRSGFEVVIQSIGDELDHFMAGASDSLAHLQEQYDYYTETQGRYVSAAKELYEVSKLNRDIENSLTTATSSAAKEALKALQEKINKQSELNELTEYDIEMNQLQYQLLLARIKLEETQNAKDIVRLTRDENGNYAYRYTANQDKIDEAAQHYEDVLQQINDLTVQRTNEIESQIVSTMQNYKEKLMQISLDYSLTEEERLLKLEELNAQYAETMQYLQEQNNIVTQNLTDNQSAIAEHYGTNISNITASTAGNVNSSVQSMIDKANEYIAAMNGAIYGEDGILANWEGYMDKIDDVNEASGTSYENLREEALATTKTLEGFQNQALDVIDTLENTLTPLSELTKAWDAHGVELDNITDKYENIVEVIQATRNAMNNFGGGTNTTANNGSGSNRGVRYATGGLADYTGLAWLDGTPEKPELVLNPTDTENLITAVGTVRSLDKGVLGHLLHSVKTTAESMMSAFNNLYHAPSVLFGRNDNSEILTQDVHITAEFPNATDRNEIEEALLGLANRASQFASRQKK